MTSQLKNLLVASLLCGSALLAHGQELKIGYVNLDRVLLCVLVCRSPSTTRCSSVQV